MRAFDLCDKQRLVTDWSGVASDDRRSVHECNRRMLLTRGGPDISYEEWMAANESSAHTFLIRAGFSEPQPQVQEEYRNLFRIVCSEGLLPTAYPDALTYFRNRFKEGRTNIIVSSHPYFALRDEAERYGIAPYISDIIGDVVDKAETLSKLLGYSAPRTMSYTGDMTFDVRAAKKAGIMAIGVATGYHQRYILELAQPHLVVDSLTELDERFARSSALA